jgi:hypothetical protein
MFHGLYTHCFTRYLERTRLRGHISVFCDNQPTPLTPLFLSFIGLLPLLLFKRGFHRVSTCCKMQQILNHARRSYWRQYRIWGHKFIKYTPGSCKYRPKMTQDTKGISSAERQIPKTHIPCHRVLNHIIRITRSIYPESSELPSLYSLHHPTPPPTSWLLQ